MVCQKAGIFKATQWTGGYCQRQPDKMGSSWRNISNTGGLAMTNIGNTSNINVHNLLMEMGMTEFQHFVAGTELGCGDDDDHASQLLSLADGIFFPRQAEDRARGHTYTGLNINPHFSPLTPSLSPKSVQTTMSQDSPFARLRDLAAQYLPAAIAPREPTLKERVENVVEQVKDQAVDTLLDAERAGSQDVKKIKRAVGDTFKDLKNDAIGKNTLRNLEHDVNAAKQHAQQAVEDARRRAERAKLDIHHSFDYDGVEEQVSESKAKVIDQVQDVKDKLGVWWSSAKHSLDTEAIKRKLEERQEEEREELFLVKGSEQQDIEEFNARAIRNEDGFAQVPLVRRRHSSSSASDPPSGMSLYERTQHYLDSNIERRTIGEHVQYAPLTGIYGGIFLVYFLILGTRLWYQRRKTDVYVGDATIERYRASKEEVNGATASHGREYLSLIGVSDRSDLILTHSHPTLCLPRHV